MAAVSGAAAGALLALFAGSPKGRGEKVSYLARMPLQVSRFLGFDVARALFLFPQKKHKQMEEKHASTGESPPPTPEPRKATSTLRGGDLQQRRLPRKTPDHRHDQEEGAMRPEEDGGWFSGCLPQRC